MGTALRLRGDVRPLRWSAALVLLLACVAGCGGAAQPPEVLPSGASKGPSSALPATPAPSSPPDEPGGVIVAPPPTEAPSGPAESTSADGRRIVTVSTVADLIDAIGPHRTVRLRPGNFQLDDAVDTTSPYVQWNDVHDGKELEIHDVEDLVIEGPASGPAPKLEVRPRYAWVLKLSNVKNVTLRRLVLGHTPAGGCTGGVVGVSASKNVQLDGVDLFGSGTHGVGLEDVDGFELARSTIRECTYGIMTVARSTDVVFRDSTFRDNGEYDLIDIRKTPMTVFENVVFRNNRSGSSGYHFFKLDSRSRVTLRGGVLDGNQVPLFVDRPRQLKTEGEVITRAVNAELAKADPQYNENYRVVRYRQWIVAATQAGVVFWDDAHHRVVKLVKAKIANDLIVDGNTLWVGSYQGVERFEGLKHTRYLPTRYTNHDLRRGPVGKLLVGVGSRQFRWTGYGFAPTTPPRPGDDGVTVQGARWWVEGFRNVKRKDPSGVVTFRARSQQYPGRDPRDVIAGPRGSVWVLDFMGGAFRLDVGAGRFVPTGPLKEKCVGLIFDGKTTWYLHYTKGPTIVSPGGTEAIDLSSQQYMRDFFQEQNGDVWVGGHRGIVRLRRRGGSWEKTLFEVK